MNQADSDDIISFVFSGHGGRSGETGYLCAWDATPGNTVNKYNEKDGKLTEYEIRDIVDQSFAKVFMFFDSCFSGYIDAPVNENNINKEKIIILTAGEHSTPEYDAAERGLWTYSFLNAYRDYLSMNNYNNEPNVEYIYNYAAQFYHNHTKPSQYPKMYDGAEHVFFYLAVYS